MAAAPLNDDKFKWVSSSLNIAPNTNRIQSKSETNTACNILTQDEQFKWVSSRLNVALKADKIQIQSIPNIICNTSRNENKAKLPTETKIQTASRLEVVKGNENHRPNTETVDKTSCVSSQEKAVVPTKAPAKTVDIETEHIQCNQCPFIAKKHSTLIIHARKVHKSYCKTCLKIFPGYHKHCKRCYFIGEQPVLVKEHIKKAHKIKKKVFLVECPA